MEYSRPSLDELYAKLTLEDEEGGVVVSNDEIIQAGKESIVLVGRFLTEKNINFNAKKNVLASLWRPKEGAEIHDIGGMRYLFVFYHPMDVQKVLEGGPWSFEQGMLIYKQISGNDDPKEVQLNEVDIWVQIYDIPKGFVSESILQSVGNYVGQYVKSDPSNFNCLWENFVRIRVKMNILEPLKRRMKMKREGGNWSRFLQAMCQRVDGLWQAREAEAISLKESLSWTIKQGFKTCVFEKDSKLLADACNGVRGRSYFHSIVGDCVELIKHFENVLVQFVHRSANEITHLLARASHSMSDL